MRSSWVGTAVRTGADANANADADAHADADESAISKHILALLVPMLMPILLACLFDKMRPNCIGGYEGKDGNHGALVDAYCCVVCVFLVLRLDDEFVLIYWHKGISWSFRAFKAANDEL